MAIRQNLLDLKDYRSVLKKEYERRSSENTYYSMRAFARDLKVSPSRLCDIMNGRYGLTEKTAKSIAANLDFNETEASYFWALTVFECSRVQVKKQAAEIKISQLRKQRPYCQIEQDQFNLIADWYHGAILELTHVQGFKSTIADVSELLSISESAAQEAVDRLFRLKLLKEEGGRWQATNEFSEIGSVQPSEAIQKFHKQLIRKGYQSIRRQKLEERELSSGIFAIKTSDLAAAKKELQEFKERFIQRYGEGENKDSVYGLSLQFFNLVQKKKVE